MSVEGLQDRSLTKMISRNMETKMWTVFKNFRSMELCVCELGEEGREDEERQGPGSDKDVEDKE